MYSCSRLRFRNPGLSTVAVSVPAFFCPRSPSALFGGFSCPYSSTSRSTWNSRKLTRRDAQRLRCRSCHVARRAGGISCVISSASAPNLFVLRQHKLTLLTPPEVSSSSEVLSISISACRHESVFLHLGSDARGLRLRCKWL